MNVAAMVGAQSGPSGSQRERAAQVQRERRQLQLQRVAHQRPLADPAVAVPALDQIERDLRSIDRTPSRMTRGFREATAAALGQARTLSTLPRAHRDRTTGGGRAAGSRLKVRRVTSGGGGR
jgi:hypothetical protein